METNTLRSSERSKLEEASHILYECIILYKLLKCLAAINSVADKLYQCYIITLLYCITYYIIEIDTIFNIKKYWIEYCIIFIIVLIPPFFKLFDLCVIYQHGLNVVKHWVEIAHLFLTGTVPLDVLLSQCCHHRSCCLLTGIHTELPRNSFNKFSTVLFSFTEQTWEHHYLNPSLSEACWWQASIEPQKLPPTVYCGLWIVK